MAIKNAVVNAIIEKWRQQASNPECEDGSEHAKLPNARAQGRREGFAICSDQLAAIANLLSTDEGRSENSLDKVID